MWYINTKGKVKDITQADVELGMPIVGNMTASRYVVILPKDFIDQFSEADDVAIGDAPLKPGWGWPAIQNFAVFPESWRGWWVREDALKELETAVAIANNRNSKPWRLVEVEVESVVAAQQYKPKVVQPHMVKNDGTHGMVLMPVEFLKGFDKDCPLLVGNPDPDKLSKGASAFNPGNDYNKKLDSSVWRAWNYVAHDTVREQINKALEYWYAHNGDPATVEVEKLLAEADKLLASNSLSGTVTDRIDAKVYKELTQTAEPSSSPKTKGEETMSAVKAPTTKKNAEITWEPRRDIALPGTPAWPNNMPPEEAAKLLLDKAKEDNEEMEIIESIADCFPWDGAVQFSRAMAELHGWGRVKATEIQTMFGTVKKSPKSISVEVDPGVFEEVIWGDFSIPGVKGTLTCGIDRKDKRYIFAIRGTVIKRDLPLIRKLADMTRKLVRERSIYRGKAIELILSDEGQINWTEQPRFLNPPVHMDDLIFSDEIMDQIGTHLIAPVRKRDILKQLGRPFGGAVLVSGTYGVGKTVLAAALANVCRDVDVTFIAVKSLTAVPDALVAARPLGPAVVFVEDIDRISTDAERNDMTQEIMNTVASVGSKGAEVMAVFTTNKPGAIAPGLVSRFNGVIVIDPPKSREVERLIRLYGTELIEPNEDLAEAAEHLSGKVPRSIEQIVQSAKQYAVHRNNVEDVREIRIIGRDIIGAAIQKEFQLQLESRGDERVLSPAEKMGKAMEELLHTDELEKLSSLVKAIYEHLGI